jgi:flagellar biosynthesis/type III secretory pathway protein FliH
MNGFLLWHRHPDQALGITADRRVLRAHEVPPLQQADELLATLQALHAGQQAQMDAACEAARADGYRRGLGEGRAAARAELASALTALTQQHETARAQQQQALARLALDVAQKLLGTLPAETALAHLAAQAARELLPARTWRLQVHPSQVATLRAALQAADPDDKAGLSRAEIVADANLADTDCRLVTEFGTADASLATQVQRLAQAWGVTA